MTVLASLLPAARLAVPVPDKLVDAKLTFNNSVHFPIFIKKIKEVKRKISCTLCI